MYQDNPSSDATATVAYVTSCSRKLYSTQIYGRCLDTWRFIDDDKYLLSEDNLEIPGFETVNLTQLCEQTGYFNTPRSKGVSRFYRKALSIFWALENLHHDFVVWLDSDVEILSAVQTRPIMHEAIATMFYPWQGQVETDKAKGGVDTGMIWFDTNRLADTFAQDYINYWHHETLLTLAKPKDTFVLIDMLQKYPMQNLMQQYVLLPLGSNYFDYTIFSGKMLHHIGRDRK